MTSRMLVRIQKTAAPGFAERGFSAAGSRFRLTPLFEVAAPAGLGAAAPEPMQWFLAESESEVDTDNDWDAAHGALTDLLGDPGAARAGMPLVEPDLLHTWAYPAPGPAPELAAREGQAHGQSESFPSGPGFAWHLGDAFSGLRSARESAGADRAVVIAHLDTGYDPKHISLPEGLDHGRQANFIEGEDPRDARDPGVAGVLRQPGHGAGTLSILAGNRIPQLGGDYLGGAPKARIVPVRVANSVVQFRTSAIARAFDYARRIGADVVSMSMGGVASAAWTDAINAAYEAGVFMVCAAGNNFSGLPTRYIVYPARYRRVVAACGVMADGRPYFGLPLSLMQGNYGPPNKMPTALAAYTPNVSWARYGEPQVVDMDGQGTSSATPQVAAAAALWLAAHGGAAYPEPWMRVEAARKALFDAAAKSSPAVSGSDFEDFFGRGILRAKEALAIGPAPAEALSKTPADTATFAFLRVITGLGIAADGRGSMLALEMTQAAQKLKALEEILPDPDAPPERITRQQQQRFFEAMIDAGKCSRVLRARLEQQFRAVTPVQVAAKPPEAPATRASDRRVVPPRPAYRRLRTFALDPSFSVRLDTAFLNTATLQVPWESNATSANLLQPGPVGEYVEVVDVDPASGACYAPVDLNEPFLLAQDGLAPSEGNPQFHQQMTYAVSMLTIRNFEQALGRVALWSPRRIRNEAGDVREERYVPRLRIYPHALRQANAYYSPDKKALLFGYFQSAEKAAGMVFSCLSHDIIAHETTHALLDGLHRRFQEASNPDVLAFHEAFADIVAIFQHFTFPEILRYQIQRVGGDLFKGSVLAELARQFGDALGRSRALRSAIAVDPNQVNYETTVEPHDRGSVLVAAVFEAFLAIYRRRTADLLRIATGGTGRLPEGALHPDLVNRLAGEAAKAARHILTICIRALDYCPPVDITFGSYLRALITADWDVVPDDPYGYRVAFAEAFRRRAIFPENARTLSIDSLRWQEPAQQPPKLAEVLGTISTDWDLFKNRREAFEGARANAAQWHKWLTPANVSRSFAQQMGIDLGGPEKVEVHSVRPARRMPANGSFLTDLVVVVTQRRRELLFPGEPDLGTFWFRGGCTMLIDVREKRIRYIVSRNINSQSRLDRQREFEQQRAGGSLSALYFGDALQAEPFALLHREL